MCTLSWLSLEDGYFVAFSRDERHTRAPGLGPRMIERAGVRAIAPVDAEAGGTWIAVNELGITLALLNGYRFQVGSETAAESSRAWKSRGELASNACDAASLGELSQRLARQDLASFRPFELVAFDSARRAWLAAWDGSTLAQRELSDGDCPMVSSSFDDTGARERRRAEFERQVPTPASPRDLELFHASHAPSRGPYSPCMHREDAHTVSFTRVRVGARQVELVYQPQSPCAGMPAQRVELPRRVVARA
jgi:hypothetical protein